MAEWNNLQKYRAEEGTYNFFRFFFLHTHKKYIIWLGKSISTIDLGAIYILTDYSNTSFQCDGCGDVVKKPKLNQHGNRCYATFTCIDCSTTFQGTSYQAHNSCMTEAEKFQKHIYQNKVREKYGSEQFRHTLTGFV